MTPSKDKPRYWPADNPLMTTLNRVRFHKSTVDIDAVIDLSKRNFLKVGAAAGVGALALGATACPLDSKKVTFYSATLSSFLNEVAGLLPAQAAFIARIIKVISDFDAAYQRGDFTNASAFFNTMVANVSQLISDVGRNLSPQLKMLLAVASATVRTIAVLLQQQGATQPWAVARARAASPDADRAISTIEKLAHPSAVDAAFAAAKL
jgi:hypothetical protein